MKTGPFFKWYGSKWNSAKKYPKPKHSILIEPFAGSAGYASNYCDRKVILFDEDTDVANLWKFLIYEATKNDILSIPINIEPGLDIRTLNLSVGQKLLLKNWQRTNNVGNCWTISKWGNLPGQWTFNTRQRISEEIGSIKHWVFGDPYRFIDIPCTYFIDPPYMYNYRYNKNLEEFDYNALVSYVETIHKDSLVIVCEAKSKNGVIPNYLPFSNSHSSVTSRRKSSRSNELVYIRV